MAGEVPGRTILLKLLARAQQKLSIDTIDRNTPNQRAPRRPAGRGAARAGVIPSSSSRSYFQK